MLAKDRDGTIPLATNNWLGDLNFLRSEKLRFDEQLGLSGGEDTMLFLEAKARGAKTGWAPGAIVFEMLPAERLTFEYQYRRSRDRSVASFHAKYPTRSWKAATARCVLGYWKKSASSRLLFSSSIRSRSFLRPCCSYVGIRRGSIASSGRSALTALHFSDRQITPHQ